jgi:hypothetical protein
MAQTLVEKGICEACGSKVRDGSSFCYNCGESIAVEPAPPAILKPDPGLLNGEDPRRAMTVAFNDPEPPPVAIPLGTPDAPPKVEAPRRREAVTEAFPAATAMRRPPRARTKKAAEVEWVERSSSAAVFVVTAIVLTVLAILMVVAALSLR